MNRRGFLGLIAGAAVTPAAKLLPAVESGTALREMHEFDLRRVREIDAAIQKMHFEICKALFAQTAPLIFAGLESQVSE